MLLEMTACDTKSAPGPEKTIGLGEGYLDDGKFQLALGQFLRYIDMEPEDEYGYLCAAEAYIGMDDTDKAADILEKGYDKTGSERIRTELDASSASSTATAMPEPASTPAPATTPDDSDAIALKEGESLYTGHLDCPQAKDFRVSFILSADLSYIHDIKLEMTDFKASVQNGNRITSVEASNIAETFSGEPSVNFGSENFDIPIGKSTIRVLVFEGDKAFIELDYVYYSSNTGNGVTPVEIPLDTIGGELKRETAPAFSGTADSAPPSGPGVFPVQYEAYGNPYSITGYTVGMDDSGNTTVTIWGDGYGVLHFGPGGAAAAAGCEIEAGEETFEYSGASISGDSMVFTFDTVATPEAITVTNGDTGDEIVSFLTADVEQRQRNS
jgi:hypothetical protein